MKLKAILLVSVLLSPAFCALAQEATILKTERSDLTVTGRVDSFEPDRSISIVDLDGQRTVFKIDESSQLPPTVSLGDIVTVHAEPTVIVHTEDMSSLPVVRSLVPAEGR